MVDSSVYVYTLGAGDSGLGLYKCQTMQEGHEPIILALP